MWAGLAITAIWLAVLFVGLFAGDIVSIDGTPGAGTSTTVPSVVVVAFFAALATVPIAGWGFGSRRSQRKENGGS
jgi:anthranilate phosphoribosyltransferase